MYPDSLKKLIEAFKLLPGVGEKSAERFAFSILNFDKENAKFLSESILDIGNKIHKCPICNNLTDNEKCIICSNFNSRNNELLCVVEDCRSIYMIENSGVYNGMYHVIDNLISPIDGINPEDIGLEKLLKRISSSNFKEVIIAIKSSIEGETTSLYIKKVLEGLDLKVTRLASGIPIGVEMEYIDPMTLERALNDRKEI